MEKNGNNKSLPVNFKPCFLKPTCTLCAGGYVKGGVYF